MQIIIEKHELVETGNTVGLMPMNDDGWIYLAIKYLENIDIDFNQQDNFEHAEFHVIYDEDGIDYIAIICR